MSYSVHGGGRTCAPAATSCAKKLSAGAQVLSILSPGGSLKMSHKQMDGDNSPLLEYSPERSPPIMLAEYQSRAKKPRGPNVLFTLKATLPPR